MKKQSLLKKLHKPVHPTLGNIVFIGSVILVTLVVIALFFLHSSSPAPALLGQNIPMSTPTSILAQSPNTTPTLLPTNGWKTYQNYGYHFSVMLPPEIVPPTSGDARFDPYSANGFLFTEQGDWRTWKDGFVFSMKYVPPPTAPITPPDYTFHFKDEVPIYGTVLSKKVKGIGWFGGKMDPSYYYTYPV